LAPQLFLDAADICTNYMGPVTAASAPLSAAIGSNRLHSRNADRRNAPNLPDRKSAKQRSHTGRKSA